MEKLGVRFAKKQHLQISDLCEKFNLSQSKVARAALQIGLKSLREQCGDDQEKALQVILVQEAKSLN